TTSHIARQYRPGWHRRHQQFLNTALELHREERRHHIGVRVGDHRHHDQAGHNKLHIVVAAHFTDAGTNQVAKDDEIQGHRDGRGQQSLRPDPGEAPNLAGNDGGEGCPQCLRCHAVTSLAFSASRAFSSTIRTNNSSSRLALVRMLSTRIPRFSSSINRAFRPCPLATSTSSAPSSSRLALNALSPGAFSNGCSVSS